MVDTMLTKKYLNQLRLINSQINSRQKELEDIKYKGLLKATSINPNKVQESKTAPFDDQYLKIWELPKVINEEIDKYVDKQEVIRNQIHQLDDQLEVLVLRERYLNQSKWEDIAEARKQTVRNIQRIHGRALLNFGHTFEKEIKEYIEK